MEPIDQRPAVQEFLVHVDAMNWDNVLPDRFDVETLTELRRAIMQRGLTLATLLAEVLADKHPPELDALLAAKPGKRPEEVIRLALDQVERRRTLLDARDDRFGRCDVCGEDLGIVALREMPWADRCKAHAAR